MRGNLDSPTNSARSMILQAILFFQQFSTNPWILRNFQACNLVVFAITISSTYLGLTRLKAQPSYTKRLRAALLLYLIVASLLTFSTTGEVPVKLYFLFLMVMVFAAVVANALS